VERLLELARRKNGANIGVKRALKLLFPGKVGIFRPLLLIPAARHRLGFFNPGFFFRPFSGGFCFDVLVA
jgi:hypothetical protein